MLNSTQDQMKLKFEFSLAIVQVVGGWVGVIKQN